MSQRLKVPGHRPTYKVQSGYPDFLSNRQHSTRKWTAQAFFNNHDCFQSIFIRYRGRADQKRSISSSRLYTRDTGFSFIWQLYFRKIQKNQTRKFRTSQKTPEIEALCHSWVSLKIWRDFIEKKVRADLPKGSWTPQFSPPPLWQICSTFLFLNEMSSNFQGNSGMT